MIIENIIPMLEGRRGYNICLDNKEVYWLTNSNGTLLMFRNPTRDVLIKEKLQFDIHNPIKSINQFYRLLMLQ